MHAREMVDLCETFERLWPRWYRIKHGGQTEANSETVRQIKRMFSRHGLKSVLAAVREYYDRCDSKRTFRPDMQAILSHVKGAGGPPDERESAWTPADASALAHHIDFWASRGQSAPNPSVCCFDATGKNLPPDSIRALVTRSMIEAGAKTPHAIREEYSR